MKRDELINIVRILNLVIGLMKIYLFTTGAGYALLGLGVLNVGVWAMTRKVKI